MLSRAHSLPLSVWRAASRQSNHTFFQSALHRSRVGFSRTFCKTPTQWNNARLLLPSPSRAASRQSNRKLSQSARHANFLHNFLKTLWNNPSSLLRQFFPRSVWRPALRRANRTSFRSWSRVNFSRGFCGTSTEPKKTLWDILRPWRDWGPPSQWWTSARFWGDIGTLFVAALSVAAVLNAYNAGPESINLRLTVVMIVYSLIFARWTRVVHPKLDLLLACHTANVLAQSNLLRIAIQYKLEKGETEEVKDLAMNAAAGAAVAGVLIATGPTLQSALVNANIPGVSWAAGHKTGPFTTHFWGPVTKLLISGTSILDYDRPVEKVFYGQYSALTMAGLCFSRLGLLTTPINIPLFLVNLILFGSSAWQLGRKVKADFIDEPKTSNKATVNET